jgi:hypothetical protein
MTTAFIVALNATYTSLILFTVAAAAASIFTKSPMKRIAAGIVLLLISLCVTISARSVLAWGVSAVERPSVPGFVLLFALALATVRGWLLAPSTEFRFATLAAALAGLALYPAAMGFFNYDMYVLGFGGYLLPAAVVAVIAYAIFRGYLITALALNIAVAAYLAGLGESRNLWDYVIDPIAAIIGCGTWIIFAVRFLIFRFNPAKALAAPHPSSGIGETPISH